MPSEQPAEPSEAEGLVILAPSRPPEPTRRIEAEGPRVLPPAAPGRPAPLRAAGEGLGRGSGDPAEAVLLEGMRRGEEPAYRAFVTAHGGRMMAVARRYFRSEVDAEDVVQDALVSIVRSIHGFEEGARLSTWVHRIVVNAALMRLRTRSRRPESTIGDSQGEFDLRGQRPLPGRPERANGCDALDLTEAVARMLARLPDEAHEAVRLRDIEGHEPAEICAALGISLSTFKSRLHRGRSRLRELLQPLLRAS